MYLLLPDNANLQCNPCYSCWTNAIFWRLALTVSGGTFVLFVDFGRKEM